MTKPTVLDLFAGAGGATQGLKDSGFRVLAAVEVEHVAADSYHANHPRVRLLREDIRSSDPHALRMKLRVKRGELSLLKACPPCQGYSSLGTKGKDDERNDLVCEVWKFVQAFEPRVVMMENVPGLARDDRLWALVRQLRGAGYTAKTYLLDATAFGVPQRRKRLILVAVKNGRGVLPGSLLELLPSWFQKRGMRTAGEALAQAATLDAKTDVLHRARRNSKTVASRLKAIPIGGNRFDLPDQYRLRCHTELGLERRATASYGRVRSDAPAPTMTTRCTTPACGQFVHPTEPRALTLREAATIQTFPLKYRFVGGPAQVERQIGNALPVRMARGLGLCVLALLNSHALTVKA